MIAVISVCITATAQQKRAGPEGKGFLILSAGPSFPIGDFSSTDLNNENAGYAKIGFILDLQGAYHITKNFGVGGSVFYSHYSIDDQKLKDQLVGEGLPSDINLSVDHWQYYGLVVGPVGTTNLSPRTFVDFSIMTGVTRANSPKATASLNGVESSSTEDWATTIPLNVRGGMRFEVGQNGFLFGGLNFMYMKPKFTYNSLLSGDNTTIHQRITSLNLTFGGGISF